jgi:hypothetical protein
MGLIYCCPIQVGGEISNYTGFLLPYSFPLPIPSSLPFSLSVLGGCQILTLEANHRQLLRYEKNGLESAFGTKKKHILKNNYGLKMFPRVLKFIQRFAIS